MRKVLILLIISLIISAYSCEKDELTVPTTVDFEFSMDTYSVIGDGGAKASSSFEIDEGTMIIEAIEFDGRRDQGEDYYFTANFSDPLKAQLHNRIMNQNVSFDIPQGIYNRIELNLSLGDGNEDALCLQGRYHRGPLDDVQIRFEYAFKEQIRIQARNNQNSEQIVLKSSTGAQVQVVFDAPYLFKIVSMNMIHNAEMVQMNGENIILINNEYNTDIYSVLVARLDNSMRVIFD